MVEYTPDQQAQIIADCEQKMEDAIAAWAGMMHRMVHSGEAGKKRAAANILALQRNAVDFNSHYLQFLFTGGGPLAGQYDTAPKVDLGVTH